MSPILEYKADPKSQIFQQPRMNLQTIVSEQQEKKNNKNTTILMTQLLLLGEESSLAIQ